MEQPAADRALTGGLAAALLSDRGEGGALLRLTLDTCTIIQALQRGDEAAIALVRLGQEHEAGLAITPLVEAEVADYGNESARDQTLNLLRTIPELPGLVHVDFESQVRTIKESGRWYAQMIRDGGFDIQVDDEFFPR